MLRIAIDAGHYKYTPGRRCLASLDSNETREWELNRRVADKLVDILKSYECETIRVDDTTGEKLIDLADRVKSANGWPADVYLSIHHNAGVNGGNGGGTVVYTAPGCQAKSKSLQKAAYDAVVARTGLIGNRSKPLAESKLYVLTNTTMPAILIECGFMDSVTDVPVILGEYFAENVAYGLLEGIVEVFGVKKKTEMKSMTYRKTGNAYVVEIPAKDFAVRLVDKAKKSAYSGNFCNAGFFGNYNEGKDVFTLPVGHTVCSFEASSKWAQKYCGERGKLTNGRLVYHEPGKIETVLYTRDGSVGMAELGAVGEGYTYAIAGVPVLRNGVATSWSTAQKQGWEASSLYATYHIFAGFGKDHSAVLVACFKTTTGNLVSSGEAAKKLLALGFTDAIKLDGGGSTILNAGGKNLVSTFGNRRVCTIITFGGNPYPIPTRTLVKGKKGDDVKWLQFELSNRGFTCSVDGSFGPATTQAVKDYQKSTGLAVDGSVGPATRKSLIG